MADRDPTDAQFMDGMDEDATILVLSHLRYDFVFQRPQQVVSRLARNHRILFVEEPERLDGPPRLRVWQPILNVQVLQPQTPLAAPGFHDDQVPILRELLQATFETLDRPIVWLYTPMALPLVAEIDARSIVYECMDELSAFRCAPRQLQQREAALLKRADVVFTGGRSLYRAKASRHPQVMCIPSAVDAAHFRSDPEWQDPWPEIARPRLGYFGAIDERIDMALLDRMAHDRPAWQILMVGPFVRIDPDKLPRRSNIHWLGQHAYDSLPRLVAFWDACLIPFALNEATRYISPTKTLEYMAAGRPIVSTHVRDVADCYSSTVRVADSVPAFIRACDAALAELEPERSARRQAMIDLAADQSWDAAVGTMERAVTGRHRRPADAVYENLVLGAGPTGLAAALGLSRDTLLVEREPRVGGLCRSIQQAGYTFDHAGRVMFSQDPYVLALYERVLGANVHWQYRESSVFSDGAYLHQPDTAVTAELTAAYNRKLWTVPLDEIEPRALHNLELGEKGAGDPPAPQAGARFGYPLRGGFQALMEGFLPLLPGQLRTDTSAWLSTSRHAE